MTIRSEADRVSGPQMNGVRCPVCGVDCFNTWGLIEHMKTHLKKSELVQAVDAVTDVQMSDWICSQCGADCGSRIGLIMHMVNCKGNGEAPNLEMTWEDLLDEIECKPGLWFDEPSEGDELEFMGATLDALRSGRVQPVYGPQTQEEMYADFLV